jgi:hypothetical protein
MWAADSGLAAVALPAGLAAVVVVEVEVEVALLPLAPCPLLARSIPPVFRHGLARQMARQIHQSRQGRRRITQNMYCC